MTRKEIFENAMHCVSGDRDEQYGKPDVKHTQFMNFIR